MVEVLARHLGNNLISLDDHLELDLGLDSLGRVELLSSLEHRFDLRVRDHEFLEIFTVRELIAFIEAKHPEMAEVQPEKIVAWDDILKKESPTALLRHLGMNGGLQARMVTQGLVAAMKLVFKYLFDLKVYGREGLKDQGYVLCPNHASFLDGFILVCAVPRALRHRLFSLGYARYFDVPLLRSLLKLIRVIPVDSARNVVPAMQVSSFILRNGQILSIFPEGSRSPSGEVGRFRKGVAILAKELDVKLVPVYIQGSYGAWPAGASLPRPHPVRVVFGEQFSWRQLRENGLGIAPGASDYDAISLGLRAEVIKLKEALEVF